MENQPFDSMYSMFRVGQAASVATPDGVFVPEPKTHKLRINKKLRKVTRGFPPGGPNVTHSSSGAPIKSKSVSFNPVPVIHHPAPKKASSLEEDAMCDVVEDQPPPRPKSRIEHLLSERKGASFGEVFEHVFSSVVNELSSDEEEEEEQTK